MQFKKEGERLSGKVNYEALTDNGLQIFIGNIFSLTETGAYFDWGLEKCGFGQFSFSYEEVEGKGQWTIMNECMGPESSAAILKAFEEAIRASGDKKAIYCLKRIISLISYYSDSLSKSILLIWNSAKKEGGEVESFNNVLKEYSTSMKSELETENKMLLCNEKVVSNDVTLYSITTNHVSYNNKNDSFYEANLDLFFNINHVKHGYISIVQRIDLNSGKIEWRVNEGIDSKILSKIFTTLENTEGEYEKIWNVWKNAVKLHGGSLKMAKRILEESTEVKLRYKIK